MVVVYVLAMMAGIATLAFLPLPQKRETRLASQIGGTVLFGAGLAAFIFNLMAPVA